MYKHVTPYIPSAWDCALRNAKLNHEFPLLVHHLTFGSPISNLPPLTPTFIPKNLPSATLLPNVISNEITAELSAGRISGPFTVEEVHTIFDGHFRTSPLGLVEKVPGDGKWRMIRHLSKTDTEGESTNGWLSSDNFPTRYYSASMTADFVSPNPFSRALPRARPTAMRALPRADSAAMRAVPWASSAAMPALATG